MSAEPLAKDAEAEPGPLQRLWQRRRSVVPVVLVIIAFLIGFAVRGGGGDGASGNAGVGEGTADEAAAEIWTCSMHPQIKLPKPGKCPICGMDLIPVTSGGSAGGGGPREITLTETARRLAEIVVAPVERKHVAVEVRMVGKVDYDERRVGYITAWVDGRIDDLFVDFTGVKVRKGARMVSLYSPDLLAAQEELLQALRAAKKLEASSFASVRESTRATVDAARERLRLWGLAPKQIEAIEKSGKASDHVTIRAPMAGVVVHKNALEGMYVKTGTRIYTIANLSHLWVMLDAYESDIAWLALGQEVEFHTETYPGEAFRGRVTFIDPVLGDRTRTVKVRLEVHNADGRLKPGMFVRAVVRAKAGIGEEVASAAPPSEPPLIIPASAPLITGKRAVVYVAVPGKEGAFAGREVVLGSRAGHHYIVHSGLSEGEMVVVNGAFKIDSAVQILAKPSMMNPEGGGPVPGHDHGSVGATASGHHAADTEEVVHYEAPAKFKTQLDEVVKAYFGIHEALSSDRFPAAQVAAAALLEALGGVDMKLVSGDAHVGWMRLEEKARAAAEGINKARDIEVARSAFALLSDALGVAVDSFGSGGGLDIYRLHCPMALDGRGADWLQPKEDTENPYFGAAMHTCGSVTKTLAAAKDHGVGGR